VFKEAKAGAPMRINLVLPPVNLSGGVRILAMYAQKLHERGHKVTVRAARAEPEPWRRRVRRWLAAPHRGHEQPTDASHFDGLSLDYQVLPKPGPVTNADLPNADIVMATWWTTAEWVADLHPSKGNKVYLIQHYEAFPDQPKARVDATWRLPMHKIAVSQWLADLAANRFGDHNAAVIPNAIDPSTFNAPPRARQAQPTVGFVYSRAWIKGADLVLEAINYLRLMWPKLRVVVFSAERPPEHLGLPPGSQLVIQPPQTQIPELYRQCDVWLVGSRTEGFGLPILEAMACRTPVVTTPVGAAPELLAKGGGRLAPAGDPAGLARHVDQVLRMDDNAWQAMAEQAQATAHRFTWDHATDVMEKTLQTIKDAEEADRAIARPTKKVA
jgi:glycosyltransferase involved in cell wall biosynthesis